MKRHAPSGTEAPSGAGLSARTRHRCKTVKEVLIWKGAQDPKAGPGSSAKIAKNSTESLFGNGDLLRQEASGWSAGSPATRGSSLGTRVLRSTGRGRRVGGGRAASEARSRHRAPAALQLPAPPPPQAGRLSRRFRAASHGVLTRLRPKQERTRSRSTFSAIFLSPRGGSGPKHFSTSLARP